MKQTQEEAAAAAAAQLRELLGEARGMVKDLTQLLRQLRETTAQGTRDAAAAAAKVCESEVAQFYEQIQEAMNKAAAELNESVGRARADVIAQLQLSHIERLPDGSARVYFESNGRFITDGKVKTR